MLIKHYQIYAETTQRCKKITSDTKILLSVIRKWVESTKNTQIYENMTRTIMKLLKLQQSSQHWE